MQLNQVLPVVPVRDITAAVGWYEQLLGRPADARPMESLANWTITDTSTLQVFQDSENAGHVAVNFGVDSVDSADKTLRRRGIVPGDISEVSRYWRFLPVTDPDGNTVTLVETR